MSCFHGPRVCVGIRVDHAINCWEIQEVTLILVAPSDAKQAIRMVLEACSRACPKIKIYKIPLKASLQQGKVRLYSCRNVLVDVHRVKFWVEAGKLVHCP